MQVNGTQIRHSDVVRAQRKATDVLESIATPDALYAAQVAMVAQHGKDAGYAAYYGALYDAADQDGRDAARETWDAALAESAARNAERAALEASTDDDQDDDDQDDDDQDDDGSDLLADSLA